MRTMITDSMWALLEPRLKPTGLNACGAKPRLPDRQFLEALLYLARTGVPWRDLPGDFGAWDAVYNRFRRWINNGRLRKLFEGFTDHPELGETRVCSSIPSCGPTPTHNHKPEPAKKN